MFYVFNVKQWLEEVVSACSEYNVDPEDSVFALVMFSSLDFDFVEFFEKRKPQISQYSGDNVHIFTPMIYDEGTVPDGEWRMLREGFSDAGIPIKNRPSAILFFLRKRSQATGFDPQYFAAFELPNFSKFEDKLRDFVDNCISYRKDSNQLARKLGLLFNSPNLIQHVSRNTPLSQSFISDVLHAPRVFISYSHNDKETVLNLYHSLRNKRINLWLDQFELSPGELFQEKIEEAIHSSDAILVVLSSNSEKSKWISFEGSIFYAQKSEKLIVPVVLDEEGKLLAEDLPFLRGRLFVDLSNTDSKHESIDRLSSALLELQRG